MPMSDKKRWIRLAVAAGLGAAAGAWTYQIEKDKKAENDARLAAGGSCCSAEQGLWEAEGLYYRKWFKLSGSSSLAYKRLPFSRKQHYGVWRRH